MAGDKEAAPALCAHAALQTGLCPTGDLWGWGVSPPGETASPTWKRAWHRLPNPQLLRVQVCAYQVLSAPGIKTHSKWLREQRWVPRKHPLPFPAPLTAVSPARTVARALGADPSLRLWPASALTWLGLGDRSAGATAAAATAQVSGKERRGPAPCGSLQPGLLGAVRPGSWQGGGGLLLPAEGSLPPLLPPPPLPWRSSLASGVCCSNPWRRWAPRAAPPRSAAGCVACEPPPPAAQRTRKSLHVVSPAHSARLSRTRLIPTLDYFNRLRKQSRSIQEALAEHFKTLYLGNSQAAAS